MLHLVNHPLITMKLNKMRDEKTNSKDNKLDKLQKDLKKAIADERYEDAAKIRDEIKKMNS